MDKAEKSRLAIGVFDGRAALYEALHEFEGLGLAVEDMTVVASTGERARHERFVLADRLPDLGDWITEAMQEDLAFRLDAGFSVLIVPIASARMGLDVPEVLLRHAAEPVQIHDVTDGPASVQSRH